MKEHPKEACAFVIDGKLVQVVNHSSTPTDTFELSIQDSALQLKAQAFLHSHPNGSLSPSSLDMISQKSANLPFGIVTCTVDSCSIPVFLSDANLAIPLLERKFIHGIFDCYSLIRSYYFQKKNITIPDFARDNKWWDAPPDTYQDLYLKNFEKANFKAIPKTEELKEGDVILMNLMSGSIVSHAAIYLGNGLILHHLNDRISREDHAPSWKKFFHTVVRYND
jgi:cell wall-associated NlpC family hydrolase